MAKEPSSSDSGAQSIGRYALYGQIAAGGMATVHLARQRGAVGFARTVAVKRLRGQFAEDPEFVAMFLDEARLAARIHHPNVVATLDVVAAGGEVFLVMEYVQGESLAKLVQATAEKSQLIDPRVVATVLAGVLYGLHAAHAAVSEDGGPLNVVHRDVSPQNILLGVDGVARVLDFGVAKAAVRVQTTREGQLKGKLSYMAPEQVLGEMLTSQTDIYAAAVVLWEALTLRRLFRSDSEGAIIASILKGEVEPPSRIVPNLPPAFDDVVARGLHREPRKRYASARDMALDLERCAGIASPSEVSTWVQSLAGPALAKRALLVSEIERSSAVRVSAASAQDLEGESTQTATPSRPRASAGAKDVGDTELPKSEVASDVSSIAVTPDLQATGGAGSRRRVAMIALALTALLVVGALGISRLTSKHSQGSPYPATAPPPLSSASASAEAPPVAAPPVAVDAMTSAQAVPDAASSAPSPVRRPRVTTPKPASSAECNPPYYFDDEGHKHYKDSCFR